MLGLKKAFTQLFGSKSDREIKRIQPRIAQVASFEAAINALTDEQLRGKTAEFRQKINAGASLDDLLPEAFAVVREGAVRSLGMRHFDVQILGGIVLHDGKIAEMKTGEGKTLVATLPVYLNALSGDGVHVVTVNDYLASRDAAWMGTLYRFLGMDTGVIVSNMEDADRQGAYRADITYGTNNEFGFDYLRDNMKFSVEELVMPKRNFAIVDEVDSILIDEARTPLIISGQAENSSEQYRKLDGIVPFLRRDHHFVIDEKGKMATLTDEGITEVENRLGIENLYEPANVETIHHINQALRAHVIYKRDTDYVVSDNEIVIVDEFTGRLMPGRRWGDGLHQAIEAKERVEIQSENQTLATITFQNYFNLYSKLSGMTGTAETEAEEFENIYGLKTVVIPTNKPLGRADHADSIYKTEEEKIRAIVEDISEQYEAGRPILVGTTSIEKSEGLSRRLKRRDIVHHVLNAKQHEREAEIVSQAGRAKSVTIATNMAGRGTDIVLGGNPEAMARQSVGTHGTDEKYAKALSKFEAQCEAEKKEVLAAGGLHIIGTERHESRRIDNQLRGRAGRQGDPGSSRFYLSLDDDLLRIFGGEKIGGMMDRLGMVEGEAIEHAWLNKAVANAQKKLEGHHFSIRKQLTEYDAVMNEQRYTVYGMRQEILREEPGPLVHEIIDTLAAEMVEELWPGKDEAEGNEEMIASLVERSMVLFNNRPSDDMLRGFSTADALHKSFSDYYQNAYEVRTLDFGESRERVERFLLLQTLDTLWKEHLQLMEDLKDRVGLVGYAQQKPVQVYKKEGFEHFQMMLGDRNHAAVERLFRVKVVSQEEADARERAKVVAQESHGKPAPQKPAPPKRVIAKRTVGRNEPCHCGSGKKYKRCHMREDQAVA